MKTLLVHVHSAEAGRKPYVDTAISRDTRGKVQMIKLVRVNTKCSLRDAKQFVERLHDFEQALIVINDGWFVDFAQMLDTEYPWYRLDVKGELDNLCPIKR